MQGIFVDSLRKWIAFFFAATGNAVVLMTNGSLAVVSSVVFLGVLMGNADRKANGLSMGSAVLLTAGAARNAPARFRRQQQYVHACVAYGRAIGPQDSEHPG